MSLDGPRPLRCLEILDLSSTPHQFENPTKKIHEAQDVATFLTSKAYTDIMTFLLQLNRSMIPRKAFDETSQKETVQTWPLNSDSIEFSEPIRRLQELLSRLESIIEEVPPDPGPRRFGNLSFRKWLQVVDSRAEELLDECLTGKLLQPEHSASASSSAKEELKTYLVGSFGSGQRLDYGTGHELSFLAFLACLWKLGGFPKNNPGVEERGIVLGVIEPYLELVRKLIKTYNLEPAGSHGVWGLDDHSFIPYIFGSAQLAPPITESDQTPIEGSLDGSPSPSDVAKHTAVERERRQNMYFSAIGFIYDVKKGPFWEHSPMLYDISGITAGWGKINKGMVKMYNAEVLSKFPVVQHFPFGSLLSWDRDPTAPTPPPTTHTMSGPDAITGGGTRTSWANSGAPQALSAAGLPSTGTAAPWARPQTNIPVSNTATSTLRGHPPLTSLPDPASLPPGMMQPTKAPWATKSTTAVPTSARTSVSTQNDSSSPAAPPITKAPWAKPS